MVTKSLPMTIIFLLLAFSLSFAQHEQMGEDKQQAQPMKMPSIDVFTDGVHVTFMVMKNESHKNMLKQMKMNEELEQGTTHNIMILVRDEKTGKEFAHIPVTIMVADPDDNEQTKKGSYKDMMRTYDAYFRMNQTGKYQIRVLFETEGKKRSIGISHDMT